MIQGSTEFKTSENGQGLVRSQRFEEVDISNYMSKICRYELAELVYDSLQYEVMIEKNECRRRGLPVKRSDTANRRMAGFLGVSIRSIRRWRNSFNRLDKINIVSNDKNSKNLVTLSFRYDQDKTREILERDIDRHWRSYYYAMAECENGQGLVRSQKIEVVA